MGGPRRSGRDVPRPCVRANAALGAVVLATPMPALLTNSLRLTLKQKNFHSAGT